MPIKLKSRRSNEDKSTVLGVFKSYVEMADFMEQNKVWSSKNIRLFAVPTNMKHVGAIRVVTRAKGGLGIHVENYGYV